jgi:hypothetical protein
VGGFSESRTGFQGRLRKGRKSRIDFGKAEKEGKAGKTLERQEKL